MSYALMALGFSFMCGWILMVERDVKVIRDLLARQFEINDALIDRLAPDATTPGEK